MVFSRKFHAMIVTNVLVLYLAPGVPCTKLDCALLRCSLEIFTKLLHQFQAL